MFADIDAVVAEQAWIINAGALAILGYHVLFGLPKMLDKILSAQKEEREAFERRVTMVATELKGIRETKVCRYPDDGKRPP